MSLPPSLPASTISHLLKQEIKPIFLLGAGASVRSGIPPSDLLVDAIARWGYCKTHDRFYEDPTLMRSDWWPWLKHQHWFREDIPRADHYPKAVEAVLKPQNNRRAFFQTVLRPGVPPSTGYSALARLLARKVVRTVLTTNFDQLLVTAARSVPEVHAITEIKTADDFKIFSVDPQYPQVVYIHGSVDHYTDQNLENETERLNSALVDLLLPLLRDHPLVVIGYRGAEPSVMRHLLAEQKDKCLGYRHGIYWCHRPGRQPNEAAPLLDELLRVVRSNLQFVEIDGFDELMEMLDRSLAELLPAIPSAAVSGAALTLPDVHDLQPSGLSLADLNESLVRAKLVAYAEAVRLPRPDLANASGVSNAMIERSLAISVRDKVQPTNGGLLLFAKGFDVQLPQAQIQIHIRGPSQWVGEVIDQSRQAPNDQEIHETVSIRGDLWTQLERASDVLARANKPFRLKGPTSYDAYPYPPLALKELLTNLLAHRAYFGKEPATISVSPSEIRFENPGGLVEHVQRQLDQQAIQSAVATATRGIKGYRNPVIADFFFSAGAMDKEGSGLPDVLTEAANNLNEVSFGPTADNSRFVAVISCRPEALAIDANTRTARATQGELRYSPNLLEITGWPEKIWKLGTLLEPKAFGATEYQCGPAFAVHNHWIWSFTSPHSEESSPLKLAIISEEIHQVPIEQLFNDTGAMSAFPRLLNMTLTTYLMELGLRVRQEAGRIRAYFPANEGKAREVSYRSIFKLTTRTVTKPIVSRTSGQTVYWEHKSVALRFERFGPAWYLALVPSYVFTTDGDAAPIQSQRLGPLTTRRAARDYNPTVLHDLVFWARVISKGVEPTFMIPLGISNGSAEPMMELGGMIPTVVFQEPVDANMANAVESEMSPDEQQELQSTIERIIEESRSEETGDEPASTSQ